MKQSHNDKELNVKTKSEITTSIKSMLRSLLIMGESLEPIRGHVGLTIRLIYYDDVTPQDYDPPGFRAHDSRDLRFVKTPTRMKCGNVITPYHEVALCVHSTLDQPNDQSDNENGDEEVAAASSSSTISPSTKETAHSKKDEDNPKANESALQTPKKKVDDGQVDNIGLEKLSVCETKSNVWNVKCNTAISRTSTHTSQSFYLSPLVHARCSATAKGKTRKKKETRSAGTLHVFSAFNTSSSSLRNHQSRFAK
jgi:hypothetical protein